jgi:hypothetical protein
MNLPTSPARTRDPSRHPTSSLRSSQAASAPHLWLYAGLLVLLADLVFHNTAASIVNAWDGWGVFWQNFIAILVFTLVLVALVFGILARWALKPSSTHGNRPAHAAALAGVAAVVSYVAYFMWAPFVVAPAALLLAWVGLREADGRAGRGYALVGGLLGALSLGYWFFCIAYALATGNFPLPGPQ